jgi:hypothetical protein
MELPHITCTLNDRGVLHFSVFFYVFHFYIVPWAGVGDPALVLESCLLFSGDITSFSDVFLIFYYVVYFHFIYEVRFTFIVQYHKS